MPQATASGPWSLDMLHGRLLGGLAARAIEVDHVDDGWQVGRLTVDLFRPAAMAPVSFTTERIRDGRRIRIVDAVATCDGHRVARATAAVLARGHQPPGRIWRPTSDPWPDPESIPDPVPDGQIGPDQEAEPEAGPEPDTNVAVGWLFRPVRGGFGTGERTRVWTNETACLVDDEVVTPLVRAAVSADIACPLANSSDQGLHYINADYTLTLGRYPEGPWVGLETAQQIDGDGISLASSTLVDRLGPFAISTGSSLVTAPLA